MSFFISDAVAQGGAPAAGQPGGFMPMILMVGMFVIFYFLLIRPQSKRAKEHKVMVEALKNGDEIVTNGGVYGRITIADGDALGIEVAEGVVQRIQRQAIATVLPKGTLKSL